MFLGTIDDNVRRFLAGNREAFAGARVVVGCSGNFTSEKVLLQECAPASVHSNDVSLYSRLLADAMLGTETPLEVVEDRYRPLLEPLFRSGNLWDRPAAVMLMLRLLKHERQSNAYQRRMFASYLEQFGTLVQASSEKLASKAVKIASFHSGDIFEHFQREAERGDDAIYMAYCPFYKGDYEAQYRRLEKILSWPAPTYPLLDDDRKREIYRWMRQPGRRYTFILDHPLGDEEPVLISHKQRNTWIYLYSNVTHRTAVFRRQYGDSGRRFRLIEPSFRFGERTRIEVAQVKAGDIQYYKGLYLARNIDFTAGMYGFALLADGAVFGFLEFNPGKPNLHMRVEGRTYSTNDFWYMLSDFPVEPKPHDKVSKLVVMLANTREIRGMLERRSLKRSLGLATTARTHRPVSMKYRGPMQLVNRGEGHLNYMAFWADRSLAEAYSTWWKQQGKRSKS